MKSGEEKPAEVLSCVSVETSSLTLVTHQVKQR